MPRREWRWLLMKWLVPLSAFQTLLLVMLGLHAIKLDMRTDQLVESVDTLNKDLQQTSPAAAPIEWAEAATVGANLTADDIRMIIREEYQTIAAEDGAVAPVQRAASASPAPQQTASYNQGQTLLTQSAIDQDLEIYKKRGSISTIEMDQLHAQIAELPPEARRAALVRLTKAINSGEIKGQF